MIIHQRLAFAFIGLVLLGQNAQSLMASEGYLAAELKKRPMDSRMYLSCRLSKEFPGTSINVVGDSHSDPRAARKVEAERQMFSAGGGFIGRVVYRSGGLFGQPWSQVFADEDDRNNIAKWAELKVDADQHYNRGMLCSVLTLVGCAASGGAAIFCCPFAVYNCYKAKGMQEQVNELEEYFIANNIPNGYQ